MNRLTNLALALPLTATLAHGVWGQTTVPHTFTPNTAAKAAEVNANFQALAGAIDTIAPATIPGSYGQPFATDGSLTGRNVLVLKEVDPTPFKQYALRIRYANTTSEMVSVNGVPTAFGFIAMYPFVGFDGTGMISSISNFIEAMNDSSYVEYYKERSSYDTISLVKTVTADTQKERVICFTAVLANQIRHCAIKQTASLNGSLIRFRPTATRVSSLLGEPLTVNGLTFTDVRVETRLGNFFSRVRLRAQGVGTISDSLVPQESRHVIYYRVGGVAAGSLAGTPFAAGQPLFGLFFTP